MMIILPPSVLANENAKAIEDQKKRVEQERKAEINKLADLLKGFVPGPIQDEEAKKVIRGVCVRLLNMNARSIIYRKISISHNELGRLISDVLLGHGQDYEIKT
jgi:hypothetical protein